MAATHPADVEPGVPEPLPDRIAAARFLSALDPQAESFTFQTFDDDCERKSGSLVRILHGSLADHWNELAHLNAAGAGIFVTINATDLTGRTAENIIRIRALFVDLDGAPLDPVTDCSTPPHIIVESSPGRWHAYWTVTDVPLEQFGPLQRVLATRFDGDRSVHDLPRVLRLPGFIHRKGVPFVSVLQSVTGQVPYTLVQVLEAFPPAVEDKPQQGNGADRPQNRWGALNERALANSAAWVPLAFPTARKTSQGYRVASADLGRGLEEDLSFTAKGIKFFGVHDMGDPRGGRRSPLDVIMEFMHLDLIEAAAWLERALDGEIEAPAKPDPLEGLVERTTDDPGAPFAVEVLEALATLRSSDPAGFERLRKRLKDAGARVTALDKAITEESGDEGERAPSHSATLLRLAQTAELFHAPDDTGYADLDVNGHRETWPIRTRGFRQWLVRAFYTETGAAPGSEALQSAINVIVKNFGRESDLAREGAPNNVFQIENEPWILYAQN